MVAGYHQLELRDVLEKVLAHETRRDLVATGDSFDLGLVPAPTLFRFDGGHEPRTPQAREVSGMPVAPRLHESVHGSAGGVVAKDRGQRVHEHRLAVGAGAVQEEQRMSTGRTSQAVADHALQVDLQVLIATGHVIQERAPARAVSTGRGRRQFGHPVRAIVSAQTPCAEIDHATWGVQSEKVRIPLV